MRIKLLPLTLCLFLLQAYLALAAIAIPLAAAIPDTTRIHQKVLIDNWAWLKDRDNPRLSQHLKQEDAYTRHHLKQSQSATKQLYKEFNSWIPKQESSPPRLDNGYYYYTRTYKNKSYPLHYRRQNIPGAREELVMDENKLASKHAYFALGCYQISPNNRFLAFSTDYYGNEVYTLWIKDLQTGEITSTQVSGISDFVWQKDNIHAIITMQNERLQTDKCYRLNTTTQETTLLFTELSDSFDLGIYNSRQRDYIILLSSSKSTTEAQYLASSDTLNSFTMISPRSSGHQYYPEIYQGKLYTQTNLWCPDYSISVSNLNQPGTPNWTELVKGYLYSPIADFSVFDSYLVLIRRQHGSKQIEVFSRADAAPLHSITPPTISDLSLWHNPDPFAEEFTYCLENEISPYSIYKVNFITKELSCFYRQAMAKPYTPENYTSRLLQIPSPDGTLIPVSLVYSTKLDTTKAQALWLSGYGAYGDPNDPWFSTARLSLLDKGFIYATAHIRGGGEAGQDWYDSGKLQNKRNTFTDYIACIDFLLQNGFTTSSQLVLEGGSAGGLLMGVMANEVPNKVALIIADVPFVDVISTMLDDSLPLTTQEYEEWGDPNSPDDFANMLSYSPYDNVKPANFPTMLISAAWFDTRVGYWEALKWAQKLRSNNTGQNPILFRMLYHEGHTGSSDIKKSLMSLAETYAYALQLTGLLSQK